MEAVAIKEQPAARVQANQAMVVGRIEHVGSFEGKDGRVNETVIAQPAPDVYSMPGVVVVQSKTRLGNKGDEVRVLVRLSGIPNSWADKQTGEVKRSANNRLIAVE